MPLLPEQWRDRLISEPAVRLVYTEGIRPELHLRPGVAGSWEQKPVGSSLTQNINIITTAEHQQILPDYSLCTTSPSEVDHMNPKV